MPLKNFDFTSREWLILKEFYVSKLAQLRVKNDARLSEQDTAYLRGQIAECKAFLALDKPAPQPADSE
jgi:hypothetical protein